MSILSTISNLVASFSRRDVHKAIVALKQDVEESVGVYESAADQFWQWEWRSKFTKEFALIWSRNIKSSDTHKENFVTAIFHLIKRLNENVDLIESMSDKVFEEEILRDGMTYISANILMYLETASFAVRYANRLLRLSIIEESRELDAKESMSMTKAEVKWLDTNMLKFLQAFDSINVDRRLLKDTLEKIPDVVVEADDGMMAAVGKFTTDPFKMGFLGVKFNPIFYVRIAVAEWQNERNEARKVERKTLEFRLMRLKDLSQSNVNDPGLKKQIDYYEDKLLAINNKIARYEEDFQ